MNRNKCIIVGAGSFAGMCIKPEEKDLVIAADGGYTHLKTMNIEPQVLLGDFDSLEVVPEHRRLIRHSPIKDDTDMALAVAYAEEEGYKKFLIYGGLGGRLDHSIANIQMITGMARRGLEAYLIGDGKIITAIHGGNYDSAEESSVPVAEEIRFSNEAKGMISVFCMGKPAKGVYEAGLKYTLSDATLSDGRALGVSNEFIGCESSISVKDGTLLIMWDEMNGLPFSRSRHN